MKDQRRHSWIRISALAALLLGFACAVSAAEEKTAADDQGAIKRGSVTRTAFTSQIVDREPVDDLSQVPNSMQRVYFFSELRGLEGQIVTHRWEYNGKVMAEVKFKVGGPRWRVYSSKNLLPEWLGKWTVVVTDQNDWPLKASIFEYTAAPASAGTAKP
jgi:hypothetical protein